MTSVSATSLVRTIATPAAVISTTTEFQNRPRSGLGRTSQNRWTTHYQTPYVDTRPPGTTAFVVEPKEAREASAMGAGNPSGASGAHAIVVLRDTARKLREGTVARCVGFPA